MPCIMSDGHASRPPEQPRSEPEIIPPGRSDRDGSIWTTVDERGGTHRIYVARPGPFSIIVALLIAGLVLAAIVLLLLGLVLFWIPVVIFIIAAFLLAGYVRYYWRRLQFWARGRRMG
ncbi:MAG: hypothetical protein GEU91_22580 [Rhizobiales bacterium]|nr:hypothetical protein [Hyphomicrobiales bacterium]